jgi:hypothetical protein
MRESLGFAIAREDDPAVRDQSRRKLPLQWNLDGHEPLSVAGIFRRCTSWVLRMCSLLCRKGISDKPVSSYMSRLVIVSPRFAGQLIYDITRTIIAIDKGRLLTLRLCTGRSIRWDRRIREATISVVDRATLIELFLPGLWLQCRSLI